MTKLTETPPYCSSCGNADSTLRWVDFDASWDGPVIEKDGIKVSIDDLVICERCLMEAFDLLDPQGLHEEIEGLKAALEASEKEIKKKDGVIQALGAAADDLVEHPIQRRSGRYSISDPAPAAAEITALREENKRLRRQHKRRTKAAA